MSGLVDLDVRLLDFGTLAVATGDRGDLQLPDTIRELDQDGVLVGGLVLLHDERQRQTRVAEFEFADGFLSKVDLGIGDRFVIFEEDVAGANVLVVHFDAQGSAFTGQRLGRGICRGRVLLGPTIWGRVAVRVGRRLRTGHQAQRQEHRKTKNKTGM